MKKSEETKTKILTAAEKLFLTKGYETVTMREIAKYADCSHTTIYLYFSDKEALLLDISTPYLEKLKSELQAIHVDPSIDQERRVKEMCLAFIHFGIDNQGMYTLFMVTDSSRVDEQPEKKINQIRLQLFLLLTDALRSVLHVTDEDKLLLYTRILIFYVHGCISTYSMSKESSASLWLRLSGTFNTGIHTLLKGFKEEVGREKTYET